MRLEPLKQFATLRQQIFEEKSRLESRLAAINQALGSQAAPDDSLPAVASSSAAAATSPEPIARRGRRPRAGNQLSLREAVLKALAQGPLGRSELVKAVEEAGYVFKSKNRLNSIGSILYGKKTPVKSKAGKFYLPEASEAPDAPIMEQQGIAKQRRTKRGASIRAAILDTLNTHGQGAMEIAEILAEVQKTRKASRQSVNQTLIQMKARGEVKSKERGIYCLGIRGQSASKKDTVFRIILVRWLEARARPQGKLSEPQ